MTSESDRTSVSMSKDLRDRLKDLKRYEREPLESVIERHISEGEQTDDNTDIESVIAEYDGRLTYDDVVNATRKAIRQELPDGALQ